MKKNPFYKTLSQDKFILWKDINIYDNPTEEEILNLLIKWRIIKGFTQPDIIWNGYLAHHDEIKKALKIKPVIGFILEYNEKSNELELDINYYNPKPIKISKEEIITIFNKSRIGRLIKPDVIFVASSY